MRYAVFEVPEPTFKAVLMAAIPLNPEIGFGVREAEQRVIDDDPIWRRGNHKLAFYVELTGDRDPHQGIYKLVSRKPEANQIQTVGRPRRD